MACEGGLTKIAAGPVGVRVGAGVGVGNAVGQVVPFGLSTVRKPLVVLWATPLLVIWKPLAVSGKSGEKVKPVTTILPLESTCMPVLASSSPLPPSKVEKSN